MSSTVPLNVQDALEAAWGEWLQPIGPTGKASQGAAWRRDNPNQWNAIRAYREGGARPTNLVPGDRTALEHLLLTDALLMLDPPDPDPDPTFPPVWAQRSDAFTGVPQSWWSWEYRGQGGFPNPGAAIVNDRLRLTVPEGVGGSGVLSAAYDGSGAYQKNGMRQRGQCVINARPGFTVARGSYHWALEWHEMIGGSSLGVNSCALGLTEDLRLMAQISGGNVVGHQYTYRMDTVPLVISRDCLLEWDIYWRPDASGFFRVWADGRKWCDVTRATLLTRDGRIDNPVFGLYNYHLPAGVDTSMDFDSVAVGAVPVSLALRTLQAVRPAVRDEGEPREARLAREHQLEIARLLDLARSA